MRRDRCALEVFIGRLDIEVRQRARSDPRVRLLTRLPEGGAVHRAGHPRRGRRRGKKIATTAVARKLVPVEELRPEPDTTDKGKSAWWAAVGRKR